MYSLLTHISCQKSLNTLAFPWFCRYPYMAVVLNFSQSWALYCLVQFYAATKDELAHIKPLYKFLTFKSIVFLTWWQGVAIALLYSLGLLKSPIAQGLQFKSSIQDFIICIEVDSFHSIVSPFLFFPYVYYSCSWWCKIIFCCTSTCL